MCMFNIYAFYNEYKDVHAWQEGVGDDHTVVNDHEEENIKGLHISFYWKYKWCEYDAQTLWKYMEDDLLVYVRWWWWWWCI